MSLMPVAEVLARVLDGVEPLGSEDAALAEAGGRVLARDLAAQRSQPPFDASAMDGYAVRASDIAALPARLTLVGEAAAGHGFSGTVGAGQAVRIFTGAPVPLGADTIVIQETARSAEGLVEVFEAAQPGAFIRPKGYDFAAGDVLLRAGTLLRAREIMLAAAMNHASLPVRRKPVVALLATGDELVPPGAEPGPDQIVSSIPAGLTAAVRTWGGEARTLGIARDSLASLADAIAQARDADILITIGGASVGEHDLVQKALVGAGMTLSLWKIAMRPGKPLMFGTLARQRVLGLPGNPVSAIICARIFLRPLLYALLGREDGDARTTLPLEAPLPANGEREHYMRARAASGRVSALPDQDSSLMRLFAHANCLIVRQPGAPPAQIGEPVPVLPLDF